MEINEWEHREQVNAKLQTLTGREGDIGKKLAQYDSADYRKRYIYEAELSALLQEGNPKTTGEMFNNGPYQMIKKIVDEKTADQALLIAERFSLFVYSISVYRRSFRTIDVAAYTDRMIALLSLVYLSPGGYDTLTYLRTRNMDEYKYPIDRSVMMDLLAIEIDAGNTAVIEEIKNICLGENNTRLLDDFMMIGVFRSSNGELHQLMCDLLLAAKLQEGLRQSILESADMGRIEAFVLVLKTIIENDLMRYSSVLRAVDVWMGLGECMDDSRRRISEKIANLAYTYLTDEGARQEAESSKDVLEIYVSLWAAATREITAVGPFIDRLMQGEKYQKLVAMYFVTNIEYQKYKVETAVKHIEETDLDVLAYVLANIHGYASLYGDKKYFLQHTKTSAFLYNREFRHKLFARLKEILPQIPPQAGYTVVGKPFAWGLVQLTRQDVLRKMFYIAGYENDGRRNADLLALMPEADPDSRCAYLKFFADEPKTEEERDFVFVSLADKSMTVRSQALENVKSLSLRENEDQLIIKLLSLKTGDIRQGAVKVLLSLPEERFFAAVRELLSDKSENKRLAGLDMLMRLVEEKRITREQILEYTALMPKVSDREKVLVDGLQGEENPYHKGNGFGLYDPNYMKNLHLALPSSQSKMKDLFAFSLPRMKTLYDDLIARIETNKDFTFTIEGYDGRQTDQVLGTMEYFYLVKQEARNKERASIDDFVLPQVWRGWLQENKVTAAELLVFTFSTWVKSYQNTYMPDYLPWVNQLVEKWFKAKDIDQLVRHYGKKGYLKLAMGILGTLETEFSQKECYELLSGALCDLMETIPEKDWKRSIKEMTENQMLNKEEFSNMESADKKEAYFDPQVHDAGWWEFLTEIIEIRFLQTRLKNVCQEDTDFHGYMAIAYGLGRLSDITCFGVSEQDMARACMLGIVPRDGLFKMMFQPDNASLRRYTGTSNGPWMKEMREKFPILLEAATEATARVIEIELKRGDTPTEVSALAASIGYHEGAENFARILIALGNETFERGYFYYSSGNTKKHVLSGLLKVSHPAKEDTAETLNRALEGRIKEKRLLEAAMYAPGWLSIVAESLGWEGLESAAWYFHAHINEHFSAEKETEVARYSPISPEEFNDGAFDVEWFKDAYQTLGKERFEILYDCAKYLTSGANHRRAQIFADATLGKMKTEELEKDVKDKRNKDKLLAYSLVPLKKDRESDLLKRYEFIQLFLKESKQFGAQRRESEGKVSAIALDNLARTAGYADALRLSWRMETAKMEQVAEFFVPKEVEDAQVWIEINEQGLAALICEKAGKRLASVPAKLKKDPYIVECRAVVSSLKDQQKRAKQALENAMIRCDAFSYGELSDLMKHPVISPLLEKLLFVCGNRVDAYEGFAGTDSDAALRIAHAYDLYQSKTWLDWQKHAFDHRLVQPFKQIFRELYLPNEDELHENTLSRRYAGHQVQVRQTVALLKSRGWTVDYETGLQKVYYKENIIATMYAAADWFSPADVEAPTLETVNFFDRKTHKALEISAIPPILFSEVMRDIDLVVSVAHVGGVDPEASHSTVEMRASIVRELLTLLKTDNVEVKERHAQIQGSLGEYTVHLGSGVAHMMGKGAINILAVPSQHRGRVFLPFADEDPRTAEIMSKILLLADDQQIKDPAILSQIAGN